MRRSLLLAGLLIVVAAGDPMLGRRLLIAGGGGSFQTSLTGLPTDGSWTRHASNPVISPTQSWEETSVQEPNTLSDGAGGWIAWCKGGWASGGATGYYTSADGITWTHYASNPVLGRGGSSVADTLSQPGIIKSGSTFYLYVNDPADVPSNDPFVYLGTDGLAWTIGNGGVHYAVDPGTFTSWGNRTTWIEGATWYQLLEARQGGIWKVFLLTSSDGESYTFLNGSNPLTSLQPAGGYNYGGPMLAGGGAIDGTYHLYYHSGSGSTSDIYHATSTDRINWTITNGGSPILTHTGTGWEIDQIADPDVHLYQGTWYMWFAAVDNTGETGRIILATAPAT